MAFPTTSLACGRMTAAASTIGVPMLDVMTRSFRYPLIGNHTIIARMIESHMIPPIVDGSTPKSLSAPPRKRPLCSLLDREYKGRLINIAIAK